MIDVITFYELRNLLVRSHFDCLCIEQLYAHRCVNVFTKTLGCTVQMIAIARRLQLSILESSETRRKHIDRNYAITVVLSKFTLKIMRKHNVNLVHNPFQRIHC